MNKVYKALVLNLPKKGKWYHGYINEEDDLRGQEIIVAEHSNKKFSESYSYSPSGQYCSSSLYVEKQHIHIIEQVGEKDIYGTIKYYKS